VDNLWFLLLRLLNPIVDANLQKWYTIRMSDNKKLGKTVKEEREKLELTQKQVAEKAGVNANWFARFERGEETASLQTIKDIFKVLKLKMPAPFN